MKHYESRAVENALVRDIALAETWRSGRFRQTPQCLNRGEDTDGRSENDESPIDSDSRPRLGTGFKVEHSRVDEA
jgi:hypothetical protein